MKGKEELELILLKLLKLRFLQYFFIMVHVPGTTMVYGHSLSYFFSAIKYFIIFPNIFWI